MRGLHESMADFQIILINGKVPVGEVADELEQRLLRVYVLGPYLALDLVHRSVS
jgi:hypothetical protein